LLSGEMINIEGNYISSISISSDAKSLIAINVWNETKSSKTRTVKISRNFIQNGYAPAIEL
jgi:hypothetical protein